MGVEVRHVWGMTETGVGALGVPKVSNQHLMHFYFALPVQALCASAAQLPSNLLMQSSAGMLQPLQDLMCHHLSWPYMGCCLTLHVSCDLIGHLKVLVR